MKKPDDLFNLIKSLSKSEKRYFKINASVHRIGQKNTYVKLFDAIDSMDEYNEQAVKDKFKGEKFADSLFSTKNYLFNMILKSLASYYSNSSPRSELSRILDEAMVLMNKGLNEPCRKLIKRAKSVASEHEMFELLLDVLNIEMKIFHRILYNDGTDEKFRKIADEQSACMEKIKNFNEINNIYNHLITIWRKDTPPGEDDRSWIRENILSNPLFSDERNALSAKAKLFFLRTLFICSEIDFDVQTSCNYLKKIIELLESHQPTLNIQPSVYILSLNNLALIEIYLRHYKNAVRNLNKLKSFPSKMNSLVNMTSIESLVSDCYYSAMIIICIQRGMYKEGISYIDGIMEELKKYKKDLAPYRMIKFYYFFAYLYFIGADYVNALHWLNRLLNDRNSGTAPEIRVFANVLKLMIHFETGDYDLLESLVKSGKRHLAGSKDTFKFEKLALDFFAAAIDLIGEHEQNKLIDDFKHDLEVLLNDPYEKNSLENLDLISWCESKKEKKPLAEILKEKSLQPA